MTPGRPFTAVPQRGLTGAPVFNVAVFVNPLDGERAMFVIPAACLQMCSRRKLQNTEVPAEPSAA